MTAQTKTKRPGRPKGAQTQPRPTAQASLSRCPSCGSTEREPYSQTRRTEYAGLTADGEPYTAIVRRWTACATCGQARIDKTYEHAPGKQNP